MSQTVTDLAQAIKVTAGGLQDTAKILLIRVDQLIALDTATEPPATPVKDPSPPAVDPGPTTSPVPTQPPTGTDLPPGTEPGTSPVAPQPISTMGTLTRAAYEDLVKLRPGYPASWIPESVLANLPTTPYPPGVPGEMTYDEGATGYRDEIGIRARASQLWAINPEPRTEAFMYANADASSAYPIHQTIDGEPIKPWLFDETWNSHTPYDEDPTGNPAIQVDVAHEPGFLFDALMCSGLKGDKPRFARYLRELKFWVSYNFRQFPANARQGHKGIFASGQQRAQAWALRDLVQLYFVLMTFARDDEWYAWCRTSISENLLYLDGFYRTGTYVTKPAFAPYYDYDVGAYQNDEGWTCGANFAYGKGSDNITAIVAPWQQAFQSSVICWAHLLGLDLDADVEATHKALATWTAKLAGNLYGKPDDPTTYDFRHAINYNQPAGRFKDTSDAKATDPEPRGITFFGMRELYDETAKFNGWTPMPLDDGWYRDSDGNIDTQFATRYNDDGIPWLTFGAEMGVSECLAGYARHKASQAWMIGGSLPFVYLLKGDQYGVRDASPVSQLPSPSETSPGSAPNPAPTPSELLPGTPVGKDGDTVSVVAGNYAYGVIVPAGGTVNVNGNPVVAGSYLVNLSLKAGSQLITPQSLGLRDDPCYGVVKTLYLVAPSSTIDPSTPSPVAPSPSPVVPAPWPYPQPSDNSDTLPISAALGALKSGQWGPIAGWTNTMRQCLPDFLTSFAENWTSIWPGAAYLDERHEVAQFNGGHMVQNMGATVYADLTTRTYVARNKAPGPKAENDMPYTGMPDENGIHKAMHGYNGHTQRPARWGYGPDLFVLYTYYREGDLPNPVGFYDPTKEFGGGDVFFKGDQNVHMRGFGGYPASVLVDHMKGWFFGDTKVSGYLAFADDPNPPKFVFVSGDGKTVDASFPNPVDQWNAGCLVSDEDSKHVICVQGTSLNVMDVDASRPTFKTITRVGIDATDVPENNAIQADRTGWCWLPGRGIVGLYKLSTGETIGLQIVMGAAPKMRVVWRNIPSLPNGVFGSHVVIDKANGVTFLNSGPDSSPLQFAWPLID